MKIIYIILIILGIIFAYTFIDELSKSQGTASFFFKLEAPSSNQENL